MDVVTKGQCNALPRARLDIARTSAWAELDERDSRYVISLTAVFICDAFMVNSEA